MSSARQLAMLGLALSGVLLAQPRPAGQSSSDEARTSLAEAALVRQAEQRMRELQAEADRLAAQSRTLLGELRQLELEGELKAQAVIKANASLAALNRAIAASRARVAALEAQRVAQSAGVRERLVEMYKRGRSGYVRLLLEAEDLRALGRMSRAVAAVARLDRLRFDAHRRTIQEARDAVAALQKEQQAAVAARAEAVRARREHERAIAAHNRRIDELDRRRDLAAQYAGELQAASSRLHERVAGLDSGPAAATPIEPLRGSLDWPVPGRVIVTRFGRDASAPGGPVQRTGIEIAAEPDQEVRAVHGGTVAFAAPFVGFGTLVIVNHGGNAFTLYGHLRQALVAEGAPVERGTVLGRAGRSPNGAEVVYFELRIDGAPVDPLQWLKQ